MNLAEKLDQALARNNLSVVAKVPSWQFATVAEGLAAGQIEEDGMGTFVAKEVEFDKIQLPMAVGNCVIEDIQRTKTGNFQVHFRRSEPA